jgi:hypothetical protein
VFSGRHLRPLPGDHQVVSKAVVIATGVAADGSREVLMRDERPTALSMDFARPSRSEPRADAIGGLEVRPEVGEIKSLMDRR